MKTTSVQFVIILSVFLNCSATYAAEECQAPAHLRITECMNYNTTDRILCYHDKQNTVEIELDATYKRLIPLAKRYDPELEKSLRGAQKAWLKFREINCLLYDNKDRELRGAEKDDCLLRMTRNRVIELKIIEADIGNR